MCGFLFVFLFGFFVWFFAWFFLVHFLSSLARIWFEYYNLYENKKRHMLGHFTKSINSKWKSYNNQIRYLVSSIMDYKWIHCSIMKRILKERWTTVSPISTSCHFHLNVYHWQYIKTGKNDDENPIICFEIGIKM